MTHIGEVLFGLEERKERMRQAMNQAKTMMDVSGLNLFSLVASKQQT